MLTDRFQRKIEYLRLSITDLCNIRCHYCMPAKQTHENILRFEEITRLVSIFAESGIRYLRITGGEPLVRKDLPKLIYQLNALSSLEEITLTTNALLLWQQAESLKAAGLKRINVHLDTLREDRFRAITRWGNLSTALAGLKTAEAVGFSPIKLNVVLQKGINDDEVTSLARFAAERNYIVRFIELMPIGPGKELQKHFLPASFVKEQLTKQWTLIPYGGRLGQGPAEYFKIVELNSVIGLIHPVSQPFCDQCNRIRMGADGRLQDCLAYDESIDLRQLIRTPGVSDEEIANAIQQIMGIKREDHGGFLLPQYPATCGMYGIGG